MTWKAHTISIKLLYFWLRIISHRIHVIEWQLTIPVNRIDTMPDRLRPSASMYLAQGKQSQQTLQFLWGWTKEDIQLIIYGRKVSKLLTRNMEKAQRGSTPSSVDWKEKRDNQNKIFQCWPLEPKSSKFQT